MRAAGQTDAKRQIGRDFLGMRTTAQNANVRFRKLFAHDLGKRLGTSLLETFGGNAHDGIRLNQRSDLAGHVAYVAGCHHQNDGRSFSKLFAHRQFHLNPRIENESGQLRMTPILLQRLNIFSRGRIKRNLSAGRRNMGKH